MDEVTSEQCNQGFDDEPGTFSSLAWHTNTVKDRAILESRALL